MNGTEKLKELINGSNNIVFFGGAGVSTESGIPDFRSTDGLYHQEYDYPPETILSHSFFMRNPEEFYRFYKNKMLCLDAKPNMAHKKLAELEKAGKLKAVITQNIDGLHQAAGSKEVLELHGSVHRNYCMKCGKSYDAEYMLHAEGVPTCSCGGRIKPDVVLYEENEFPGERRGKGILRGRTGKSLENSMGSGCRYADHRRNIPDRLSGSRTD